MCIAGGKRCEYSDALANVRRKTRSKIRTQLKKRGKEYDMYARIDAEQEVQKAVRQFQKENPELVAAHLPEKMPFNTTPPKWDVPDSLLEKLGPKKDPVVGLDAEGSQQLFTSLKERRNQWKDSIPRKEWDEVHGYTQNTYESINPYLRGKGYKEWEKQNPHLTNNPYGGTYVDDMVKPRIASIDAAMEKAPVLDEPVKLYRFFRVPPGVTPEQYLEKYFKPGEGFQDKGYLSASADSEYVSAHVMWRMEKEGRKLKNDGYVIMEILSDSGASVQKSDDGYDGSVQSVEAETLIKRGAKMRIVDSGKKTFSFGRDRDDLLKRFGNWEGRRYDIDFNEGTKVSLPVVRMVDEALIRKTRAKEKEGS